VNISDRDQPNDDSGPSISSVRRRRTTHGVILIGAACVVVGAAVGAVLILRDDPSRSAAPTPIAASAPTVAAPRSTWPATTSVPATPSTTATPVSTIPDAGPSLTNAVVDFGADAPALEPAALATSASGFVGVTDDDRLFVAGSESVVLLDGTTGAEVSTFAWPPNATRTVFGIGPDDVLYVNEQPDGQPNNLVAYAPAGDQYIEVARIPHTWGDVNPELDETGVALIDPTGAPSHLDYVDATGAPSGKTLALPAVSFNESARNVCDFTTPATQWRVTVMWPSTHLDDETFYACEGLDIGRDNVAVLTTVDYQTAGDPDKRVTILSDGAVTFRSDGWSYVGGIGARRFFTRDAGNDTIEIGTTDS